MLPAHICKAGEASPALNLIEIFSPYFWLQFIEKTATAPNRDIFKESRDVKTKISINTAFKEHIDNKDGTSVL